MTDRFVFRPRVDRVPGDPPLVGALAVLARAQALRRPVLLDSAAGAPRRFSLLGFDPVLVADAGALLELRPFCARLDAAADARWPDGCPSVFHGGFLGALAYDLGSADERLRLPPEPYGFPLIVGGLYVDFFVRDEAAGTTWLCLGEAPGDGRPSVAERRAALLDRLAGGAQATDAPPARPLGPLVRHTSRAEHVARVRRAQEEIAAGEIYQANVAHRFTRALAGDPIDLYLRLRASNPAPYMGYVGFEEGAVLSSSPELLLEIEGSGEARVARTRPIKGTAARSDDPVEDAERRRCLLASAKDLAELAMIVDLERNDLGRVAEVKSVRAEGFPRLESYAAVHHLVADVACRVRADRDAFDVLAALFPGGSITGAPKLRAMEVIADLEGEGRGFFTGSLGMLDTRGRASFNVLIRTLLWRPTGPGRGEASFRVGGGITWASDPELEDDETLAKASALAAALGA